MKGFPHLAGQLAAQSEAEGGAPATRATRFRTISESRPLPFLVAPEKLQERVPLPRFTQLCQFDGHCTARPASIPRVCVGREVPPSMGVSLSHRGRPHKAVSQLPFSPIKLMDEVKKAAKHIVQARRAEEELLQY